METQFKYAVLTGDTETVKLLIKKMTPEVLNTLDEYGRSIIFDAIVKDYSQIVYELCLHGINIDHQDKKGKTPLHFAAIYRQLNCSNVLIDFGANVNTKDINGNSPLFDAVFNSGGNTDLILLLKENGADYLSKNKYGVSPKDLAHTIANFDVSYLFN